MQKPSIFTQIINGDIPSHKIYEDDKTVAFLDIYSVVKGHTLVVSKKQVEFVWDLEREDYIALMETVQKVALHLREVLQVAYVGEKVMGTDVPHAHVHLVPFDDVDTYQKAGIHNREPDHEALAVLAATLALHD